MSFTQSFHDNQPIWWFGRVPVYLTTVLVALFAVGMIVTTVLESAGISIWPLIFSVGGFWKRGWYWEPLTCIFIGKPDFFFLIGILFFYTASVEVEKHLGRAQFGKLLAILLVLPPILLTILWKTLGA